MIQGVLGIKYRHFPWNSSYYSDNILFSLNLNQKIQAGNFLPSRHCGRSAVRGMLWCDHATQSHTKFCNLYLSSYNQRKFCNSSSIHSSTNASFVTVHLYTAVQRFAWYMNILIFSVSTLLTSFFLYRSDNWKPFQGINVPR